LVDNSTTDWIESLSFSFAQRAQALLSAQLEEDPVRGLRDVCRVLRTVPRPISREERCCIAEIVRRIAAVFHVAPGTLKTAPLGARLNRRDAGDMHVARALRHAVQYFNRPELTLESTARECQVSGPHLSHLISVKTGVPFNTLKSGLRLLYAMHMLVTTAASIQEIAYACGYAQTAHIDHEFDRWLHMPPHEFRRLATPTD
jgi:transcriptional regulator GlxA family with amidase domain